MNSLSSGFILRINDDPISIDKDYKNQVKKLEREDGQGFFEVTIRDHIRVEFNVMLTRSPFDKF